MTNKKVHIYLLKIVQNMYWRDTSMLSRLFISQTSSAHIRYSPLDSRHSLWAKNMQKKKLWIYYQVRPVNLYPYWILPAKCKSYKYIFEWNCLKFDFLMKFWDSNQNPFHNNISSVITNIYRLHNRHYATEWDWKKKYNNQDKRVTKLCPWNQ